MVITEKHIIAFISNVSEHGGELTISPHDWLNPKCGYSAKVRYPANTKEGYAEVTGDGNNSIEALKKLIESLMPANCKQCYQQIPYHKMDCSER